MSAKRTGGEGRGRLEHREKGKEEEEEEGLSAERRGRRA